MVDPGGVERFLIYICKYATFLFDFIYSIL